MGSNGLGGLPIELKEKILLYLPNVLDQYNLAKACTEFNEYLEFKTYRSLDLSFEFCLNDESLLSFFNWVPNPQHVVHLNLNGLSWIDPEIIKYATTKFANLESFYIVDTGVENERKNLEVLSEGLKKLRTLAINNCNQQSEKSFTLVQSENDQNCIKVFKDEYTLEGDIVNIIHPENKFSSASKRMDWINEIILTAIESFANMYLPSSS